MFAELSSMLCAEIAKMFVLSTLDSTNDKTDPSNKTGLQATIAKCVIVCDKPYHGLPTAPTLHL